MAICIRNGSARIDANGDIFSNSGILDVSLREAPGVYLLTMNAGAQIAPATCPRAQAINVPGPGVGSVTSTVERVSQSQLRVRLVSNAGLGGVAGDTDFILTTSGVQVG